jgi:hypothetical protein
MRGGLKWVEIYDEAVARFAGWYIPWSTSKNPRKGYDIMLSYK